MNHDDEIFVRNFALVLVGLFVIALVATVLAKFVNYGAQESWSRDDVTAARIAPVGGVNTGEAAVEVTSAQAAVAAPAEMAGPEPVAQSEPGASAGKAVYDSLCFTCHAQGIAGAPKFGDMAAWEARVEKGRDTNIGNAISGFAGSAGVMPAKGGNPSLSDEEVAAAVDYMLTAVGGGQQMAAAVPSPAADPEPEPIAEAAPAAVSDKGKEVYDAACFVCHAPGAAGAPRFGDAQAWGPRIEKGVETLYHNSIKGYMGESGVMPPKGGRPDFSDEDVKAAVDYMVSNAR